LKATKPCADLGPKNLETLAQVYALTGRQELALDILEQLRATVYQSPITPHLLKLDPVWDSLRDNPRFQALLPSQT